MVNLTYESDVTFYASINTDGISLNDTVYINFTRLDTKFYRTIFGTVSYIDCYNNVIGIDATLTSDIYVGEYQVNISSSTSYIHNSSCLIVSGDSFAESNNGIIITATDSSMSMVTYSSQEIPQITDDHIVRVDIDGGIGTVRDEIINIVNSIYTNGNT